MIEAVLLLAAALLGAEPARPEPKPVEIGSLMESIGNLQQRGDGSEGDCDRSLAVAARANTAELFYAAGLCSVEKRATDAAFFLLAGQVRSTADMQLFEPDRPADEQTMASLWGLIFYQFGGAGDDGIFRDPDAHAALMARLDEWAPSISSAYDPGWNYKRLPAQAKYDESIRGAKRHRRRQLDGYARLVSDQRYFSASNEIDAIQRRNPGGVDVSTTDGKRSRELMELMQRLDCEINKECETLQLPGK